MLDCNQFYDCLQKNGIDFFSGVPDSLLKDICACIEERAKHRQHFIAANEGSAIAISAGYHLATGKTGLVYLQNSGLGNAVNPLTSLTDPEVYGIPILLLIGWRGEPGISDEPQHKKQGKITLKMLELLGIPFTVLPPDVSETVSIISETCKAMRENHAPYALVVRKGTFASYPKKTRKLSFPLQREEATQLVLEKLPQNAVIVSTTGKISREIFELRELKRQSHAQDFLTVGSMGHCSQIALGIASASPHRSVVCLDGDGSVIMHMGSLGIIGKNGPENFKHIVLNNGAHESVGGQPTVGLDIDLPSISKACGYVEAFTATEKEDVLQKLDLLWKAKGPALLEIRINLEGRQNLGRPTSTPSDNKIAFMNFLNRSQ